jgi:hypothetical protein
LQDLETKAASLQCFDGGVIDGIARYGVPYPVLDSSTHMDALTTVRRLESYDPKGQWLAQFSDPNDRTLGGRMVDCFITTSRSIELQAPRNLVTQFDLCAN